MSGIDMHRFELWMGNSASLDDYIQRIQAVSKGLYAYSDDDSPDPVYFDLQGNLGIVPIKGSLTNSDAWYNRFLGLTSYTQIRNALIEASQHPDVETILMTVDSGGGSASGVSDLGQLIKLINADVKPVVAHTSGTMASAAYWLGASAGKVYASDTAAVGSVGVIAVHMDISKSLQQDGIKATVFRAGDYKALANPYEPLSDRAKAQMQSQLDTLYSIFVDHVADARGVSAAYVKEHMADGKEFIGKDAKDAGLVDEVLSLDQLVQKLQAEKPADSRYKEVSVAQKSRKLTDKTVAAIAAGVDVKTALEQAPESETETTETRTDPTPEANTELPATDPTPAAEDSEPKTSQDQAPLVNYLQTQLDAKTSELVDLKAANKQLEAQLAGYKANEPELCKIVAQYTNKMQIALGGIAVDLSKLPADTLLAQCAQVQETFNKTFPVGGVTATPSMEESPTAEADPAKLRAVKLKK
jgi:signal peptide peptidase SppA